MTQHTPGPWRTAHGHQHPVDSLIIDEPTGEVVADFYKSDKPRDEINANARLIAAAPLMRAALAKWDQFMRDNYSPAEIAWWDETRAAIAATEPDTAYTDKQQIAAQWDADGTEDYDYHAPERRAGC